MTSMSRRDFICRAATAVAGAVCQKGSRPVTLIDRDLLVDDVIDRVEGLESKVRKLQEYSFTTPTAGTAPEQPNWAEISGWVMTGTALRDVDGRIVLDASVPSIQIAANGYIESSDYIAGTSGFQIDGGAAEFNDVVVRGTIYADVGDIAGWTIAATTLSKNDAVLGSAGYLQLGTGNDLVRLDAQDAVYRIWVGHAVAATAPFSVTKAGVIKAESGAVGGWMLSSTAFTGGNATLHSTGYLDLGVGNDIVRVDAVDANYRLWVGHATAGSAPFRVTKAGVMTATSGTLGSLDISGVITVGPGAPYIEIDGGNKRIRTSNYVADSIGFTIEDSGDAEFNNVRVRGELRTTVFSYNEQAATAGTLIVSPSAGKLLNDVTTVASPTTFNVDIEDPASGHVALFSVSDVLRLKDGTGDNWVIVSSVSDQATFYRYVCTLSSGAATTFRAGLGVVDYGQSGDGAILLTADLANAPYMRMFTHAGSPWAATTERLRLGNLNGVYGYVADTYGIAFGQYGANQPNVTIDDTNGFRVRDNTTVEFQIDTSGNVTFGAVVANQGNMYWNNGNKRVEFRGGAGGTTVEAYIETSGAITWGGGVGRLDSGGVEIDVTTSYQDVRSIRFLDGSDITLQVAAYSSGGRFAKIEVPSIASENSELVISATAPAGFTNKVTIATFGAAAGTSMITLAGVAGARSIEYYTNTSLFTNVVATAHDVRIDGGLYVGANTDPTDNDLYVVNDGRLGGGLYIGGLGTNPDPDDIHYDGNLKSMKNATHYDVYGFHPLAAPLTSASWDGDSHSDTAKTLIDLSAVFGAPVGIKAVLLRVACRDSGSAANAAWIVLSPNNTAYSGISAGCGGLPNDFYSAESMVVPCDGNGDIYYQIEASGASTLDVVMEIWGYYL